MALRIEVVSTRAAPSHLCLSVPKIRELVPESQAYMDLLAFERKLDQTIMRKRLDIQEALKRPIKVTGQYQAEGQGRGPGLSPAQDGKIKGTAQLSVAFKLHLSLPPTNQELH